MTGWLLHIQGKKKPEHNVKHCWTSAFTAPRGPCSLVESFVPAATSVNIGGIDWGKRLLSLFPNLPLNLFGQVQRGAFHCGFGSGLSLTRTMYLELLLSLQEFIIFTGILLELLLHCFKQRGGKKSILQFFFPSTCLILVRNARTWKLDSRCFYKYFFFFFFWLAAIHDFSKTE